MSKENPTQTKNGFTARHYVRVVAFAVLGLSAAALLVWQLFGTQETAVDPDFTSKGEVSTTTPFGADAYTLPEAQPVRISIPAINLETTFVEPLGLNPDQTIEVPDSYEEVGWYQYGPTPGELGPAVVLGHVDSRDGPAIFFSLGQLEPGEIVEIERVDGSVAQFEVTALKRYEQSGFPTELVYGDIDHAGLRLITCSGTYDRETLRYTHNLVVYGKLIEPEEGAEEETTAE